MSAAVPHISICICTYRRPELLRYLLKELSKQETAGLFTYSAIVIDNDEEQTAKKEVTDISAQLSTEVLYDVEGRRNIALARNRAVAHARGDFVAFIDDDEFPTKDWLLNMFNSCARPSVSGVLGPVLAHYNLEPPRWVRAGGFYERPRHSTGFKLQWTECRSGNVLIRKTVLDDMEGPFRTEFASGGEDQDFFRRAIEKGNVFLWCDEAVVYEFVPPSRWTRRFMLSRALLRGRNSMRHRKGRLRNVSKAIIAVPIYSLALPVLFVIGHAKFMKCLVKWTDHTGCLLALIGLNPVRNRRM
jgi:succinoglycan biosynthesis protein ExoM